MNAPTKLFRILFLDKYAIEFRPTGLTHFVLTKETDWNPNPYDASAETCAKIAEITATQNFDLVILGNNIGAGVKKFAAINERLRSKVIVVFHDMRPRDEEQYAGLKVPKFMNRRQIPQHIQRLTLS